MDDFPFPSGGIWRSPFQPMGDSFGGMIFFTFSIFGGEFKFCLTFLHNLTVAPWKLNETWNLNNYDGP